MAATARKGAPAGRSSGRSPKRTRPMTQEQAQEHFAEVLATGALPSLRSIRRECRVGAPRAQQILTHLQDVLDDRAVAERTAA